MNSLLTFLIIHSLVCIVFFAVSLKIGGFQDGIYKLVVIFFLPVFGILFFIISGVLSKSVKRQEKPVRDYLKYIHDRSHIYHEEAIDFESEINTVPLKDTLEFKDSNTKRSYLIYILKKDFSGYIKGLKQAVKSSDSETSHYAAAALLEIKKQFELLIQSSSDKYNEDKNNLKYMLDYIDVLKKYLKSAVADRVDYFDYLGKYSDALEKMLLKHNADEIYWVDRISADIELGDYENAFDFCRMFRKQFPNSEKPYLSLMKLFYTVKDYRIFKKILDELMLRKIGLTEQGEKIINFWEVLDTTDMISDTTDMKA
ncbi:MAG: hypothetical protein FJW69_01485 [Actinobacteria bacterium]|nr:hypothetical protein [Actinomycetota bacterium]MBM3712230.1 hypothetical protein [Actinomycetota bacterium]